MGITWEGTPVPDFAGTIAVASTTAAMLFLLAVTLGFISPSSTSSRSVEAAQTIAQKN
jgi:cell division protein FtsX